VSVFTHELHRSDDSVWRLFNRFLFGIVLARTQTSSHEALTIVKLYVHLILSNHRVVLVFGHVNAFYCQRRLSVHLFIRRKLAIVQ